MSSGELIYDFTGIPNQYNITFKLFRDVTGIPAPGNITISFSSVSLDTSFSIYPVPGVLLGIATDDFCADNNASTLTLEEWRYNLTQTLPQAATDWVISVQQCCRNNADNMQGQPNFYISAFLDNKTLGDHSSARFNTIPVNYLCVGRSFYIDNVPSEANGDSLLFRLAAPWTAEGVDIPYVAPYGKLDPLPTNSGVNLNARTGLMFLNPSQQFRTQMALEIVEFRYDSTNQQYVRIGRVRRDFQISVEQSCIPEDVSFGTDSTGAPELQTAVCGDSTFLLVIDEGVQCASVARDGSDFRMNAEDGSPMAIISAEPLNCDNDGMTDSILVSLIMTIAPETGYWINTKVGFDNNVLLSRCGIDYPEFDSAYVFLEDCFFFEMEVANSTVNDDLENEVTWSFPVDTVGGFPWSWFTSYEIYRAESEWLPYTKVGEIFDENDTTFVDNSLPADVDEQNHTYKVRLTYKNGQVSIPYTNSVTTMLLTGDVDPVDTTKYNITWNPYNGWEDPLYKVFFRKKGDAWGTHVGSTFETTYQLDLPILSGVYEVKVETAAPDNSYKSESNWIEHKITAKTVSLCMPNVFTPDGAYPYFNAIPSGAPFDPNVESPCVNGESSWLTSFKGEIYNRWGRLVYVWDDYETPEAGWSGENAPAGTYYYIVKAVGLNGETFEQTGSFQLIRN